ncbi:hypothetical protein ACF06X_17315 [Streptomyces sp. NPDC015346]|uniref:hypothetical protein n=1 Tax=Streptomyces sp. NPDC015346 TaxID=3364954 RepID=UPI0036FC7237
MPFSVGAHENNDGSCGFGEIYGETFFDIIAKHQARHPAGPGTGNIGTTQQGGTSTTPVNSTGTTGILAATGSNNVVPQIGLAGAAAVVLGAGTMVVARRRKAGSNA